jgi:glycosyltransferase involved in cell wall biosynthesis
MPPDPAEVRVVRPRTVWIVNHYADAPDRPNGTRHFDLARHLVRRGHRLTVFAAGFSHVTGREERLARWQLFRTQRFDGVRFVWLRTTPYRGNTWRRQVNMLSFVAALLVVSTREARPDVVIGSTVHPFAALGAWFVAWTRRALFLFEVRDLWPQTLVDLGALREGSPRERLLRGIEAFLVRRAAAVITLLPGMRDYLRHRGLPANHVHYIPNGVDLVAFEAAAAASHPEAAGILGGIARMHAEGRFVLGYVGSFGRVNRVDVILEAVREAERRDPGRVGLIVVGDGPERAEIEALADPASTVVLPPVPKRAVPAVLRAADAAVVHATATQVYRYGISFNKLFEAMAASQPVLFACSSDYDPVATAGAGRTLPPDDPAAMAGEILALAGLDPEVRSGMGRAGRAFVEREHDVARLAQTLAELVEMR